MPSARAPAWTEKRRERGVSRRSRRAGFFRRLGGMFVGFRWLVSFRDASRARGRDEGAERVLIRRIDGTHRVEARTAAPSRRRPPWTAPASAAMLRACHPLAPRGITLRDPPLRPWLSPPTDWPRPRSRAAGPRLCLWCGDKRLGRSWPPLAVTCQQRIGRATQRVARRGAKS